VTRGLPLVHRHALLHLFEPVLDEDLPSSTGHVASGILQQQEAPSARRRRSRRCGRARPGETCSRPGRTRAMHRTIRVAASSRNRIDRRARSSSTAPSRPASSRWPVRTRRKDGGAAACMDGRRRCRVVDPDPVVLDWAPAPCPPSSMPTASTPAALPVNPTDNGTAENATPSGRSHTFEGTPVSTGIILRTSPLTLRARILETCLVRQTSRNHSESSVAVKLERRKSR
jgi:hypothetical protein